MVDYICMAPNGTATVWIRDKNGKADGSKLKTDGDISMERSQFHFADADGKKPLLPVSLASSNTR